MPDFEILEHSADIGFRAFGASLPELFAAAALAVQSIALECEQVQPRDVYEMSAMGEDCDSLLVNWLNEVIYFLDAKRVVMVQFEIKTFTGTEVTAQGRGETYDPERHRTRLVVKAATYHQLKLVNENGCWTADVFLDI